MNNKEWMKEYKEWTEGNRSEELKELEESINVTTKEGTDYKGRAEEAKEKNKRIKRMKDIQKNISKVKNILEYRDQVKTQREAIKEKLDIIDKRERLQEDNVSLERVMNKLTTKKAEFDEKYKNGQMKEEDYIKFKEGYTERYNKNQEKFGENLRELQGLDDIKIEKSKEDLEKEDFELGQLIGKCNLACGVLMDGRNWNQVELALDTKWKNRKFTSKQKLSELAKSEERGNVNEKVQGSARTSNEKAELFDENGLYIFDKPDDLDSIEPKKLEEPEEKTSLAKKSRFSAFLDRHPSLKSFVDKIKGIFKKNEDIEGIRHEAINLEDENGINDNDNKKDEDFKAYLKRIAEKGLDGIEEEKQVAARERYNRMKEKAQDPNRYVIDENGVKHDTLQLDNNEGKER